MMSALPSMGSGILISQMGKNDLVRIDGAGHRSTVTLPASSQPIAGIGKSVFIRSAKGEPAVIPG